MKVKASFGADLDLELRVDAEKGRADSGDLEHDLWELLIAVAEAAASKNVQVGLFSDALLLCRCLTVS